MENESDRVLIFDTTLRDGEQSPGISLNAARSSRSPSSSRASASTSSRPASRSPRQATSRPSRASRARSRAGRSPALARTALRRHRGGRAGRRRRRAPAHPHLHLDLRHPHRPPAADDARGRARPGARGRRARARARRGRRVLADGRDALRARVHRRGRRGGDRGGRDHDQHSRHRRLRDAARVRAPGSRGLYVLVPALRDVVLSVHCHDDLGLAVANSFAGVRAGARQVECAINGIGERAGNASLEEIVMLLATRAADIGLRTGVNTRGSRARAASSRA